MARCADDGHDIGEWQDSLVGPGAKPRPVSHMLFRPEEMDAASGERPIRGPSIERNIHVTMDRSRAPAVYHPVTHHHAHWFTAIKTGRFDLNRFTWKDPADRQGFEASLREPSLVSVNGDAVLRGEIVEGCE